MMRLLSLRLLPLLAAACLLLPSPVLASGHETDTASRDRIKAIDRAIRLRDYAQAVRELQPLAAKGLAQAQYRLAGLYRNGRGVQRDLRKARELYRKAAEAGLPEARYALALLLLKKPSSSDREEARHWLQMAAEQGHRKARRKLKHLADRAEERQGTDPDIETEQIFSLVRGNELDQLKRLAARGQSLNLKDGSGNSPLETALRSGHPQLAEWLIDQLPGNADTADLLGKALLLAARKDYSSLIPRLLERGAAADARDESGNTALHIATRHQNRDIIRLLLNRGANPRLRNRKGLSPLQLATDLNLNKAAAVFRAQGLKLPERNRQLAAPDIGRFEQSLKGRNSLYKGWPLINIASLLGETTILEQLLQKGADIGATDPEGNTALHRAASKGQLESARLLRARGAAINPRNDKGETPLYLATVNRQQALVQWLLKQKADAALQTRSKSFPLLAAIRNRDRKAAQLLSTRKLTDEQRHRTLQLAIQQGMEATALALLERDRLASLPDRQGRSLLWLAADQGLARLTAQLLRLQPGQLEKADKAGYSPVARAVLKGHDKVAWQLIRKQADLTGHTREGNSLLMLAVLSGKTKMVDLLLQKGLDINERNQRGDTALMLAAAAGNLAMVRKLIQAGADTQVRNHSNLNAERIARNAGHDKVADYIKENRRSLFKLFE